MRERYAWLAVLVVVALLALFSHEPHAPFAEAGLRLAGHFSHLPSLPMFEQCELVATGESAKSLLVWAE